MIRQALPAIACIFAITASAGQPTDIDTLLRGREYKLPALDASLRNGNDPARLAQSGTKATASEGLWVLQFDAVADFDMAQKRRGDLAARTGLAISMVFDAPFYKLRGGGWSTKAAAEDQARVFSTQDIQAFVVKAK